MFENGKMWADDVGKPIQAHGGCIIQHDGMWYWYGEHKGAKNCPGTTRVDVIGISCYSSKDMNSWRYEGLALDVKDSPKGSLIQPENVCERPKVLYNKKTGKFVMWMHLDTPNYTYAGVAVAVADRPIGPFTVIREMQPNRTDSRDMTLFKDVDGTAWLVHSSDWNKTLRLSRLTEDFTDVDGFYASALTDQTREAPALMYRDGKYYMITSGCTGWQPNSALYAECDHLCGQWKLIDNPCEGDNYRRTFEGQSTDIFEKDGKTYLMLDHWKPKNLKNSGYSILPVTVENGILTVKWQATFPEQAS